MDPNKLVFTSHLPSKVEMQEILKMRFSALKISVNLAWGGGEGGRRQGILHLSRGSRALLNAVLVINSSRPIRPGLNWSLFLHFRVGKYPMG